MAEQKVRTERCEFLQIYNEGGAVYLTVRSSYQQTVTFDHNLTLNITFSLFYFFFCRLIRFNGKSTRQFRKFVECLIKDKNTIELKEKIQSARGAVIFFV